MTWSAPDGFEMLSSQKKAHRTCYERAITSVAKDKLCNEADKIFNSKAFKEAELPWDFAEEAAKAVGACHDWPEVLFEDCVGDVSCDPEKLRDWVTKTVWCLVGRMDICKDMSRSGLAKAKDYPGPGDNYYDAAAVSMILNDKIEGKMFNQTVLDACAKLFGFLYVGEAAEGEEGGEDNEEDIEDGSDNSGLLDDSDEDEGEESEEESDDDSEEEEDSDEEVLARHSGDEGGARSEKDDAEEVKKPAKIAKRD
jgi:hypothetical protein